MKFGVSNTTKPLEIYEKVVTNTYEIFKNRKNLHRNRKIPGSFCIYVQAEAWDAAIHHVKEFYEKTGKEASGIIIGYYFQDKFGEFAVGTRYEPGTGDNNSAAYCEISVEDHQRIFNICKEKEMVKIIWFHSHPGMGAFYSQMDQDTLKNRYNASFQAGVVVDFITKTYRVFKAKKNGIMHNHPTFNLVCKTDEQGYHLYKPFEKKSIPEHPEETPHKDELNQDGKKNQDESIPENAIDKKENSKIIHPDFSRERRYLPKKLKLVNIFTILFALLASIMIVVNYMSSKRISDLGKEVNQLNKKNSTLSSQVNVLEKELTKIGERESQEIKPESPGEQSEAESDSSSANDIDPGSNQVIREDKALKVERKDNLIIIHLKDQSAPISLHLIPRESLWYQVTNDRGTNMAVGTAAIGTPITFSSEDTIIKLKFGHTNVGIEVNGVSIRPTKTKIKIQKMGSEITITNSE